MKRELLPPSTFQYLAVIFTALANGNVPPIIIHVLRTTYLVALQKDPNDSTKLRPLGIPAALQHITAHAIARKMEEDFAMHVLPNNFAFGICGGITFVLFLQLPGST